MVNQIKVQETITFTSIEDSPPWLQNAIVTGCFIRTVPNGLTQVEAGDRITRSLNGQLTIERAKPPVAQTKRYTAKPETVEAVQFIDMESCPNWLHRLISNDRFLYVEPDGWVELEPGDYVVRGADGNPTKVFYAEQFERKYCIEITLAEGTARTFGRRKDDFFTIIE